MLQSITQAFDQEASERLKTAIVNARSKSEEAVLLLKKCTADSKFQLKALAAKWHSDHVTGAVENCPLCEQGLTEAPSLIDELEDLRTVGDAAARTFDDNLNAILAELEKATPVAMRKIDAEILELEVRDRLLGDLRKNLVLKDRYANCLVRFGALVNSAMSDAPAAGLPVPAAQPLQVAPDVLKRITERLAFLERLLVWAEWFGSDSPAWTDWWESIATQGVSAIVESREEEEPSSDAPKCECLSAHISRLSDALATAEPYRNAADAMRKALTAGKTAAEIEKEVTRRDDIADSLAP